MSEAWKRNLAVPFFTQRDNTYIWQQKDKETNQKKGLKYPMAYRSCNITSLCMLLHYWGITEDTPNQMMEKMFEHFGWVYEVTNETSNPRTGAARFENWADLKEIAQYYISLSGQESFSVHQNKKIPLSIDQLRELISKGFPIMLSTGLTATKDTSGTTGHIVVVRGFTDSGDVILNDPFGIPVDMEGNLNRIFAKRQFQTLDILIDFERY